MAQRQRHPFQKRRDAGPTPADDTSSVIRAQYVALVSPELARHLVRPLIAKHPLPWRLDYDWTVEVYDAKDQIVTTLMYGHAGQELIDFANEVAAYDARGAAEAKKLLADAGIEIED